MPDAEPLRLRFLGFELDEHNVLLTREGVPVALPPKAFAVLCTLARWPGTLVTKDALLDAVWGHRHVSESVLKTTISELRAALQDDARAPRCIATASRHGYRFIAALGGAPASAQRPAPAACIGRADALARLQQAWAEACEGRARIVWIAGEAGIGKTTLIDAFTNRLDASARSARGQCVEQFGAAEPYLPLLEALGALCRDDPALAATLRSVAPAWLLQLPWLSSLEERELLRRELAGTSPDRMLRELGELLDRCTAQRPLLLITEDLHWSDHATVRLIDHLARRRGTARLLWIGSFRVAELVAGEHPLQGLRHELRLRRLADEILLDPFSEQEVADYLAGRLPEPALQETFVRALHARSEGLPLFLVNLLDDLTARHALAEAQRGDEAAWGLPENLAGVIDKQIARLPAATIALLEAASACGVEFRAGIVAEALQQDEPALAQQCDDLARQQVWLRAGEFGTLADGTFDARYVFRHALYRQVLYQRLGALAKVRLHLRIAAALERARGAGLAVSAAELASHYERGHDPLAALRHYAEAVDTVLARYAPPEAMALTGQALALLPRCPDGPARLALELALLLKRGVACAQLHGMSSPEAKALHERAQAICDRLPETPALGWVLGGLGLARYGLGEYEAARALGERVQALADQDGDAGLRISAGNLLGMSAWSLGELEAARRWMEAGLAAADSLGGHVPEGRFFVDPVVALSGHLALVLLALGLPDQAQARVDAGLVRGRSLGHPMSEALSNRCAALLAIALQAPARAAAHAEAMKALGERHAILQAQGSSRLLGGWAEAQLGDPVAGLEQMIEGHALLRRIGMVAGSVQALGFETEALILAGETVAARSRCDEAWQLAERLGERARRPELLRLRALIERGEGQGAAAAETLRAMRREAEAQHDRWSALAALVELARRGEATDAERASLPSALAPITEGADTVLMTAARALA